MKKLICVLMLLLLLGLTGCPRDTGSVRKTGTVQALRIGTHIEARDPFLRTVQAAAERALYYFFLLPRRVDAEFIGILHSDPSDVFLILDVLLYRFERRLSNGRYKVRIRPQGGKTGFQCWELRSQGVGRYPFDMPYSFVDTVLWVNLNEQMHMVGHYFHFDYISVDTVCGF